MSGGANMRQPPPAGRNPEIAILIRTHFIDKFMLDLARRLRAGAGYDVIFVLDATCPNRDVEDFGLLLASPAAYAELGLFCPQNVLWRCGDYGYYLAHSRFEAYAHFWLLEADVHIAGPEPGSFFNDLDRLSSHDFLCANFRIAEADWSWRGRMADAGGEVHRCFFPITRMSRRAVRHLSAARRRAFAERAGAYAADPKSWPNDEVFCATTLARDGFAVADFNAFGRYYTPDTLTWMGLFHPRECVAERTTLFHPVRRGIEYLDVAQARGFSPHRAIGYLLDDAEELGLREHFIAEAAGRFLASLGDNPARIFGADSPLRAILARHPSPDVAAQLARILAHRRMPDALETLRALAGPRPPPILNDAALGKTAWQSSLASPSDHADRRAEAEAAICGADPRPYAFCTEEEDNPWWTVDLKHAYAIGVFRIANCEDETLAARLQGFTLKTSLDGAKWETRYRAPDDLSLDGIVEIAFDPPVPCRFARVELARPGVLHFRRFEAFGERV